MKIYKKLTQNFTVISNEIFKYGLSYKAIGIYLYIVSKPDGWDFSLKGMASQSVEGIDSLRTGVKELETTGFLLRSRVRDDKGKVHESDWLITDTPLENPIASRSEALENPTEPTLGNPIQVNTKEANTKKESIVVPQGGFASSKLSTGKHLAGSRLRVPSKNPKKKYSSINDLNGSDFQDIASQYHVPLGLVKLNYEALKNYCESKGRRYLNYKSALRNFVLKDARTKVERRQDDPKRGVDFTNLE